MTVENADEQIEAVLTALDRDPRIDTQHHSLRVYLQDDHLVLEGAVANIAAKKLAVKAARGVWGPHPLMDRLRVVASKPATDGVLRDEVVHVICGEPAFADYTLRIKRDDGFETLHQGGDDSHGNIMMEVHQGTVSLSGDVGSLSHRRLAEVLVWWTAGCEVVHNRLKVVPAEEENDGELADALYMVLEKDPLVHAGQLSVQVRDGVVVLDGYVASEEERRLAELDAWYVPGVVDVVDQIKTRG